MNPKKFREWTIFNGHTAEAREFISGADIAYADNPKVIEKAAYDIVIEVIKDMHCGCMTVTTVSQSMTLDVHCERCKALKELGIA